MTNRKQRVMENFGVVLEMAGTEMLSFSLVVNRMDNMKNEQIRGTRQFRIIIIIFIFFVVRLRCFANCNVPKEGSEYIGRGMQRLELVGWRPGGRTKWRFVDGVKVDKKLVGVRECH